MREEEEQEEEGEEEEEEKEEGFVCNQKRTRRLSLELILAAWGQRRGSRSDGGL